MVINSRVCKAIFHLNRLLEVELLPYFHYKFEFLDGMDSEIIEFVNQHDAALETDVRTILIRLYIGLLGALNYRNSNLKSNRYYALRLH